MSSAPYKSAPAGPASQTMVVLMPNAPHEWKVELYETCCAECGTFCYALCCPNCLAYSQRKRLLAFTGEPYSCCARESIARNPGCCDEGYTPPVRSLPPVWPPPEGQEPEVLRDFQCELCLEATCCLPCAIDANRRLMQYKFNVHDSSCDQFTICCSIICCACNRDRESRQNGFATLMACMLTQQAVEMREEEAKRPNVVAAGPAHQSMGSPVMPHHPHHPPPPHHHQPPPHHAHPPHGAHYGAVMPPQGAPPAHYMPQQPYQAQQGYPGAPPAYNQH